MARPKIHDEALRVRLLEAAAAVVFDVGVDALSLRRVAADVGTSTTAVYTLFGNKAGLLDSLFGEAVRRFAARLAEVAPTDDPVADVLRLGMAYRDYALTNPHLYAVMFDRRREAPSDGSREDAAATLGPLIDAVRRGQDEGTLLADVPAESIAMACWGIAHGLVSVELADLTPPGLDVGAGYPGALRAMLDGWSR